MWRRGVLPRPGEPGERGRPQVLGYFSKEKRSEMNYNLACILTMPQHQRKGLGTLMISLSYALNRREGASRCGVVLAERLA